MDLPDDFLGKVARDLGQPGQTWARQLPSIAEKCRQAWHLTDCVPVDQLSVNYVAFCTSEIHGDAVLKIQGPHPQRFTGIEALRLYGGRRCCRLLAVDVGSAAILLQRARPGLRLRKLPERARQLDIGAHMIADLPVALPPHHDLPTYSSWLDHAIEILRRDPGTRGLLAVLQTARRFYQDVDADSEPSVLLHGDLHHDNILQAEPDAWMAVDPQGVTGARFLEAGRFIQNHVLWGSGPMDEEEVSRTIQYVADCLGEPWNRIAKTLYILHALTVCWCWEAHEEWSELERMCQQCSQIQSIIRQR